MGSTFGGLNTVLRGLYAQQVSLNTIGHNISNANTDGYSRQNVNLATTATEDIYGSRGANQAGTGVTVNSITRARDTFVDRQMWKESSSLGYGQTLEDTLGKIEGVFSEPSSTGLQTVLNQFWTAWQTLSTNASDAGARTAVRQRGVQVANAIQHETQQLKEMAADINSVVDIKVGNVNQISSEIYSLNHQISIIEVGGGDHANDLRDRRDLLVDQLSSLVNVSVNEDQYGNYSVLSGGVTLADGNGYTTLATTKSADPTYGYEVRNIVIAGSTQAVNFTNGEIKGLLDSRDSTTTGIKAYLNNLDNVSKFLLQDFNAVHRSGYGTDNISGRNFFGADSSTDYTAAAMPTGGWTTLLQVNPALFDSANGLAAIAAKTSINGVAVTPSNTSGGVATVATSGVYTGGTNPTAVMVKVATVDGANNVSGITYSTDGGKTWGASITGAGPYALTIQGLSVNLSITAVGGNGVGDTYSFTLSNTNNASGDNAVLLGNRLKTDTSVNLGNTSLDTYYSSVIGTLGVQSQDATRLTDNQTTLIGQIKNWRESTAGVNMDEEMTNMIRFQKGYNAAARILTTMDEMLDKLINSTGVVGR